MLNGCKFKEDTMQEEYEAVEGKLEKKLRIYRELLEIAREVHRLETPQIIYVTYPVYPQYYTPFQYPWVTYTGGTTTF